MGRVVQDQPNFEAFKVWFLNKVMDSLKEEVSLSIIKSNIATSQQEKRSNKYYEGKEEFLKDFNKYLDNLDIRQVSHLIERVKQLGVKIPKKYQSFTIDYNKHDSLDLIFIN